jgi:hypothetical protein
MFSRFVISIIFGFHVIGCSGVGAAERPRMPNQSAPFSSQSNPVPTQSAPVLGCVPVVPHPAWTNPYAGYARGVPTDPNFFPIAVWLQGTWHAPNRLAQMGINVYVGNNAEVNALTAGDLQTLQASGIYAIVGQDAVGLANINSPALIGWWMSPDEPDNAQSNGIGGYGPPVDPSTIMARYRSMKAADSTRPVYLGLGQGVAYNGWTGRGSNPPPESSYVPASDIISFDIYPYNGCSKERDICGKFWLNAFGIDRLRQWSTHNQAVWTWIETTKMHGVSGPAPTQTASQVWLSLIHGANGIGYFIHVFRPSFREDGVFNDPTMVAALTSLNAEIRALAPQLNSANIAGLVSASSSNPSAPIDFMVKSSGNSIYVFSAISRPGTATGTFTINGMSGNGIVDVVNEHRTLPVTTGTFSDAFAANGAHVYKIDMSAVTCN